MRIWRPTITYGGALREEQRTYAATGVAATRANAAMRRPSARYVKTEGGLAAVGERVVYMAASTDVRQQDVLELVSGPDAGMLLEVDSPPTRPRGHHVEITCRIWNGTLPEDGS